LPLDQCPAATEREQDPPQVGYVSNVLQAVLGDLCIRQRLAPNLVASGSDIKLLVRARQQGKELPEESLLTSGWRSRHILPELLAVLEGRRSLCIVDITSDAPFSLEEIDK
jgi:ribonuclease D